MIATHTQRRSRPEANIAESFQTDAVPVETGRAYPPSPPARQIAVLGASNVAYERRELAATAAGIAAQTGPTELFVAGGYGRSFVRWSYVGALGRTPLPKSGLVRDLLLRPAAPDRTALVTDIGNDLFYGHDVPEIVEAVDRLLARLGEAGCRTAITALPVGRVERVPTWAYHALHRFLYPGVAVRPWADMRDCVRRLDDAVARLADRHDATLVPQRDDWYGFDPIHRRVSARPAFWRAVADAWGDPAPTGEHGLPGAPPIRVDRPARGKWFGRRFCTATPPTKDEPVRVRVY
ncbi:MAG: hypothetical protein AAF532_04675 [Planctomycetota bacterium]